MITLPNQCVVLLDVGHGNCTLVRNQGVSVVIDTGPGSALLEFLIEQKIETINTVLISHADQDHISGLIALLASETVRIGMVRLNTDSAKTSKAWDDLLYELDQQSTKHAIDFSPALTRADTDRLNCGEIRLEVAGPSTYLAGKGSGSLDRTGRKLTTNSVSVVLRIIWNSQPVILLAGDIDRIGLDDILAHNIPLTAPILVWPHHGGRAGSGDLPDFARELCIAVQPGSVVFSTGRDSGYQTPRPEVISAIKESVKEVRISCTQLSRDCAGTLPPVDPAI